MNPATPELPLSALALCFVPVLGVCFLVQRMAGVGKASLVAAMRMLLQLSLVGYALIALFRVEHPLPIFCTLTFMMVVAGWISMRPLEGERRAHFLSALLALLAGPGLMLLFLSQFVLTMKSWFEPRFVVPLGGMLLANSMNSLSVAAERFSRETRGGVSYEVACRAAVQAGMIGVTNSLLAVGLVSLPGMMTGQILAGVSPLLASRYQIMVMGVLFSASGLSIATYLWHRGQRTRTAVSADRS